MLRSPGWYRILARLERQKFHTYECGDGYLIRGTLNVNTSRQCSSEHVELVIHVTIVRSRKPDSLDC